MKLYWLIGFGLFIVVVGLISVGIFKLGRHMIDEDFGEVVEEDEDE